ncbi:MAG TPA: ABC transporter permease [Phycisphaerales bacterium]|nr:ABC transporter permease [Phycisphaerales bacterium]
MGIAASISRFGLLVLFSVVEFGRFTTFAIATTRWLVSVRKWLRWRLLAPQFFAVGVASIPVVAITGGFIGMVLALESFEPFRALGQEERLGGVINISVMKQIGPVLAAVMVAGRVGCALAAELGTMRVTEQLDAMRAMATDPIPFLVVPRFIACLVMTPLLTIYSDLLGVWGGYVMTVGFHGVSANAYWQYSASFIHWWEPASGLIKSVFFGGAIGMIACYKGFYCRAGAAGVGRAATEAFVASFLAIIIMNLVLAQTLNALGRMLFFGDSPYNPLG